MERLIIIVSLMLATSVQAGELKINENDAGITAEYTGTPADKGSDSIKLPTETSPPAVTSAAYRRVQIERLKNEAEELAKVVGKEGADEPDSKSEIADDVKHTIETITLEIPQIKGNVPPAALSSPQPVATGSIQPVATANVQFAVTANAPTNAADSTYPKVETIAEQRNKRQAMKNEVRALKEAMIRYSAALNP